MLAKGNAHAGRRQFWDNCRPPTTLPPYMTGPTTPPSQSLQPWRLRPMRAQDLPAVLAIQREAYQAELHEDAAAFRQRLHSAPALARVAEDAEGVCAYLFGYRSRLGQVTPLDGEFAEAHDPDCLYLHDLAVARRAAGRGLGPALVAELLASGRASRLRHSALVAVQESQAFWRRLGYRPASRLDARQQAHLDSYGVPALYMVQALG